MSKYRWVKRGLAVYCLTSTSLAMAQPADPLASLQDEPAQANYCFYTRSMALQAAAVSGKEPMKLLAGLQTLKTWEQTVEVLLPDKDMRRQEMIETLSLFEEQTTRHLAAGSSKEAATQSVIDSSADACAALLTRLTGAELEPRSAVATVAPVGTAESREQPASSAPTQASQPLQSEPRVIARPATSPFHKEVFAPGWRGDLVWQGSAAKERAVLSSFDHIPPGKDAPEIHANLRVFGSNARAHCVDHIVEIGSSPDGTTLYAKPVAGNTCGESDRVISLYAAAEDQLRIEIREGEVLVAAGGFKPVAAAARFKLPTLASQPQIAAQTLTTEAADPFAAAMNSPDVSTVAREQPPIAPAPVVPEPANRKPAVRSRGAGGCLTCLPAESVQAAANDLLTRLLDEPLQGRFAWDWQETGMLVERAQGTLTRISKPDDKQQQFSLTLDSEYSAVCVGMLQEVGRSAGGYLIHLMAAPRNGKQCKPLVTHGYLLPFTPSDKTKADFLWIKLFSANDKLVTSAVLRSDLFKPAVVLDADRAQQAWARFTQMEAEAENGRKHQQQVAFRQSPEFARLEPFYNQCMQAAPAIFGVENDATYCKCLSQKFGIGGRIPQAEFDRYAQDITPLIKLITGPHTSANELYTRLGETCRQCSFPDNELETWCNERDSLLYVASNYADMIRLLDTDEPIVEATEFYRKVFYRTYLQGYSAMCEPHIVNPVEFEYIVTETRYGDPWSGPDTRVTQRDKTYVASNYAPKYKRFREETQRTGGEIVSLAPPTEASLRRTISDAQRVFATEQENRQAISAHLSQGCMSRPVTRVYANLLHLVD